MILICEDGVSSEKCFTNENSPLNFYQDENKTRSKRVKKMHLSPLVSTPVLMFYIDRRINTSLHHFIQQSSLLLTSFLFIYIRVLPLHIICFIFRSTSQFNLLVFFFRRKTKINYHGWRVWCCFIRHRFKSRKFRKIFRFELKFRLLGMCIGRFTWCRWQENITYGS